MKLFRTATIFSLSLALAGPLIAQQACAPTNNMERKQAAADAHQAHRADRAQARADNAERKALHSHKVKKAAKEQDKADAQRPPQ